MQEDNLIRPTETTASDPGVWISREEYDRLRQTNNETVYQGPNIIANPPTSNNEPISIQLVMLGLLAAGLFLAFTNEWFSFLTVPLLIIFAVFSLISFTKFFKTAQGGDVVSGNVMTGSNTTPQKKKSVVKWLLIITVGVLVVPVVVPMVLFIFLMIIFSLGGGPSS